MTWHAGFEWETVQEDTTVGRLVWGSMFGEVTVAVQIDVAFDAHMEDAGSV